MNEKLIKELTKNSLIKTLEVSSLSEIKRMIKNNYEHHPKLKKVLMEELKELETEIFLANILNKGVLDVN